MTNGALFLIYASVMLVAGVGIPVMATLNSGLGSKLQNPVFATVILFTTGSLLSGLYLLLSGHMPKSLPQQVPWYLFLGAPLILFYVLSATFIIPKFGVGNAISFVLLGQLISMAAIDHFKLFGAPHNPINLTRFLGLLLMTIGVFLAVRRG